MLTHFFQTGDRVRVLASTWEKPRPLRDPTGEEGTVRHIATSDGSLYVKLPERFLWFNPGDLERLT